MTSSNTVRRAVRYALFASAVAASGSMSAMAADEATTLDKVVVTGSRIAQPNLETTSPVTQVTAEDIAVQGVTRVEDLINQLPQAFAAQNATVANGSTGTATIDLRGLGSARTLVLVDGRRMPYGGVTNSAVDINQIPAAMVERVEVLTGGASAVYGSDAISGVVNFIMKKDFEGVQIDGQYSFYQHTNDYGGAGQIPLRDVIAAKAKTNPSQFALPEDNVIDGNGVEGSLMIGVNTPDGRGNITAYFVYSENEEILQGNRDYSACTVGAITATSTSHNCGGSSTAYPGRFLGAFNYTIDQTTGNTFRNFNANLDQYNFGPLNHYLRPDERFSFGAMGHYELSEHADVYTQLMFTDDKSVAQIAPGGIFLAKGYGIHCDNPLLSTTQRTQIGCVAPTDVIGMYIGRRNVEGGGRNQTFDNSSFRALGGVKGMISDGWDYDISAQFSRVSASQITNNYFVDERIDRALDVVVDPVSGAPACRSAVDLTDVNCVPYNLWSINGVTDAALGYIQAPGLQIGTIDQHVFIGQVTGDLANIGAKLPWADDSIKVAFGFESRTDKLINTPDALLTIGGLSGSGGATIGIEGTTRANDMFAEANIPLMQGKSFAEQLSVDMAYRHSDYSTDIATDTYKFGADWAPIQDIRLRASYQHAVRAANIVELFTARGLNLFDMANDPCGDVANDGNPGASQAECVASGVPAANYRNDAVLNSPAGQYNFLQGGNTTLQPEDSTTYTAGIVFTPSFLAGFSLSIDWFDITIDDTISTFGSSNTLDACYNVNDAAACSRIHRAPNGALWLGGGFVEDVNINIGSKKTNGYDLNVNYAKLDLGGAGSLNFNLTGTLLKELTTEPGPGVKANVCAGYYSGIPGDKCGTPSPTWRHLFRTGWNTPVDGLSVSVTWRYYSSVTLYGDTTTTRLDHELAYQSYFDIYGSYSLSDKVGFRLGINNVTDEAPPLTTVAGTTGNGNTYPQTYDALGRYIFAGFTVKL